MLSTHDFSYHLPDELIAQEPAHPRDSARLMLVNRQTGEISHHHIYDLPQLLDSSWAIVANNTKVFPARILGRKSSGGRVEVLLLHPLGKSRYRCISKPGLAVGSLIEFSPSLTAQVTTASRSQDRTLILRFNLPEGELRTVLSQLGSMPTPPYIKKMLRNPQDYQTIYAKYGFSAAAPTAGLHFTPKLLKEIKSAHPWHELTLDVGLGTFLPVKVDKISDHHMHRENYTISPTTAALLNESKKNHKLLSIGTTTTRALESSLDGKGQIQAGSGSTDIFLYPPHRFRSLDGLLTNFHLPESTLLMLVSAFASSPNTDKEFTTFSDSLIGRAYNLAVQENYRFFSFGDAMLII